jgi:hypothetical protein
MGHAIGNAIGLPFRKPGGPSISLPVISLEASGSIMDISASISASVNPKGGSTVVTIEYGTTSSYGNSIICAESPLTGNNPLSVSGSLTGLNAYTLYHWRVKAVNSVGTVYSSDHSFQTDIPSELTSSLARYDFTDPVNLIKDDNNYVSVVKDIKTSEMLGPEQVVNGNFINDSAWSLYLGTVIQNGVMHCNTLSGGTSLANQLNASGIAYQLGQLLKITYTISNYVSGNIMIIPGGYGGLTPQSGNGTYTQYMEVINPLSNNMNFIYTPPGFVGDISNFSIKLVLSHHLRQSSALAQPLFSSSGVTFNGVNSWMKTDVFPVSQPLSCYIVLKQVTWRINGYIHDGLASDYCYVLSQSPYPNTSPNLAMYGGGWGLINSNLPVGIVGVITEITNGANCSLQVNNFSPVTGSLTTISPNGFTIGSVANGDGQNGNFQIQSIIFRQGVDDANTQTKIKNYLYSKYNITP